MNNIQSKSNSMLKGYICVIISAIIFGTMPLMAKHIYADGVNSITLVFLRSLLSLPVLAFFAFKSGQPIKLRRGELPYIAITGVVGCALTPLLLFSSYNFMDTGIATVFHFVYPAFVVLIGFVFFKKKVNLVTTISLVLCIGGMCLFYNPGEPISLWGSIISIASGVTYAIYVVMLAGFKRKELSGWILSFYITLVCAPVMLIACVATNSLALPSTLFGWGMSLLFAIAVNVGAVVLFQSGTRIVGGEKAAILSAFEPITGVLVGFIVFGEAITIPIAIGSVLVIGASVIIAKNK